MTLQRFFRTKLTVLGNKRRKKAASALQALWRARLESRTVLGHARRKKAASALQARWRAKSGSKFVNPSHIHVIGVMDSVLRGVHGDAQGYSDVQLARKYVYVYFKTYVFHPLPKHEVVQAHTDVPPPPRWMSCQELWAHETHGQYHAENGTRTT